jgi:hypothetical protein
MPVDEVDLAEFINKVLALASIVLDVRERAFIENIDKCAIHHSRLYYIETMVFSLSRFIHLTCYSVEVLNPS